MLHIRVLPTHTIASLMSSSNLASSSPSNNLQQPQPLEHIAGLLATLDTKLKTFVTLNEACVDAVSSAGELSEVITQVVGNINEETKIIENRSES